MTSPYFLQPRAAAAACRFDFGARCSSERRWQRYLPPLTSTIAPVM
jgi:hypothetical protein